MLPVLHEVEHGFGTLPRDQSPPSNLNWFALVREGEATTIVAPVDELEANAINHVAGWARISLEIHSDLAAVGLTATTSKALTEAKISANVIAGYYHDHFFVQWASRHEAVAAMKKLALTSL